MSIYKQPKSKNWSYKFTWNGELIRASTKQTNKRVAAQMEAAHKTSLAKGEVGIRERKPIPTLKAFAENDFLPYVCSTFAAKVKTKSYYENGVKNLLAHDKLANESLDAITSEKVAGYVAKRQGAGLQVASINRELEVLRRMLKLATDWGKVDKVLPKVSMLSGERHRERVLSPNEEARYFEAAMADAMKHHAEPLLLRDVAAILMDCGLRPEECFRLRWAEVRDGAIHILHGKTENARRGIPMTPRVVAMLEMRRTTVRGEWVFPAATKSGHVEKSSLKKQHSRACREAGIDRFPLYTFRHTCLTRWAAFIDPYTLGDLAGHGDFATTKRYIHPQADTIRDAMERARSAGGGHTFGHTNASTAEGPKTQAAAIQ